MNALTKLKEYQDNDIVKRDFEAILGKKYASYLNSVVTLVSQSNQLQNCSPESIMSAAKRSATLDLPIDKSLGFACIVAYGKEAQFQMQYKGFIQLAIRTGEYKGIDATEIYEDELVSYNRITNEIVFTKQCEHKQRDNGLTEKIVGYYGWFELHNGFRKERFISKDEALRHAKQYSKSYQYDLQKKETKSIWSNNPTAMGIKTVLKMILGTYGIMSIEMQEAFVADNQSFDNVLNDNVQDVQDKAGSIVVDVEPIKPKKTTTKKQVEDVKDEFSEYE